MKLFKTLCFISNILIVIDYIITSQKESKLIKSLITFDSYRAMHVLGRILHSFEVFGGNLSYCQSGLMVRYC